MGNPPMAYGSGVLTVQGNALSMPWLASETVDLIVTSPPYFALRDYTDGGGSLEGQIGQEANPKEFVASLVRATEEMMRVLKPTGSIFVNLGDKYAGSGGHNNAGIGPKSTLAGNGHIGGGPKMKATRRTAPDRYNQESGGIPKKSLMGLPWRYALECIDSLGLILREEIIWSKPNGLPESVKDRCARKHEQWFHFVKQGDYFADLNPLRTPPAAKTLTHRGGGKAHGQAENPDNNWSDPGVRRPDPRGVLPRSVWSIASEPLRIPEGLGLGDHFAAFPQEWPRRLITAFTPVGFCIACGQARTSTWDVKPMVVKTSARRERALASGGANRTTTSGTMVSPPERSFTGFVCGCSAPTAPTKPAVVLDPFGGTGTVAGVAKVLGRRAISVDLSADYTDMARWRIYRSGHFAKSFQRTYQPKTYSKPE